MSESPRPMAAPANARRRRALLIGALVAVLVLLVGTLAIVLGLRPTEGPDAGAGGSDRGTSSPPPSASPTRTATPTPTPSPTLDEPAPPPPADPAPPSPPEPVCADDVLVCVNIARTANGLDALAADGTLDAAAQECANRMAASGQLTHSSGGPGGYSTWGENIAVGYPSAASVFEGWMNSAGHRANILNPSFTSMGIGYASGNWWCQQFGG